MNIYEYTMNILWKYFNTKSTMNILWKYFNTKIFRMEKFTRKFSKLQQLFIYSVIGFSQDYDILKHLQ